ncbi:major allergen Pru av 1-like [Durio zibethinus]|uniref:Major allergen Pru av 1-like n=1 Tax=Durio zibethinus TaxID=66656 RepID=A0A6P6A8J8_DURZI|nr:major allergen Pru av 1-like [Durio zibethinus]
MGVFTYESEVVTSIPPAKMFKACILDGDKLIPKVVPQAFKSVEYIEGNGEPGSIKKVTFGEGYLIFAFLYAGSQFNHVKQKIEALDKENFVYSYSIIEGDALMNTLEKITYETKLEPSAAGGSICKTTSKYYTIGDLQLKEEEIKAGKEKASGMFKAIEAYLLANPDAC